MKWLNANRPTAVVLPVTADTSAPGLKLDTKGRELRIEGKVTGTSTQDSSMFGFVEASVAKHPGAPYGRGPSSNWEELKGASVMAYPGETALDVAKKLAASGLGAIASSSKNGELVIIDTTK
jgi:hypothetical protein